MNLTPRAAVVTRTACCWTLAAIFTATAADAFKGAEHRKVSRDALCIALDYVGLRQCSEQVESTRAGGVVTGADDWICDPKSDPDCCGTPALSGSDEANIRSLLEETASNISYADFVAFVDYVLDPIKLLERDASISGLPRGPKDLNEDFLFRLRSRPTLHAWAARSNDSHFQAQMMMSWWLWHRQAVIAAAIGDGVVGADPDQAAPGRLFAGLLMNAIADHYLEDFFAPGHVVPLREGLQDSAAISMHDLYNRTGARFEVAEARIAALTQLLAPARHAALLDVPAPALAALKSSGFPNPMKIRGDGYLLPSDRKLSSVPNLDVDATSQRVFVTLVVVRTIVDVLESYACRRPVNRFPDYVWTPMRKERSAEGRYVLAAGGMAYGEYAAEPVPRVDYGLLTSLEVSSQSAILSDTDDARGIISAVVIPTFVWAPPPGMNVDGVYVASHVVPTLSLGLSYRVDRQLPGYGGFVRVSVLSPRLDLNMGMALGVERYSWEDGASYRFHPEVRVGVGVSLISLFGAVGYDHALDNEGDLEGGLTVRSGIQFGIPWSKIPR